MTNARFRSGCAAMVLGAVLYAGVVAAAVTGVVTEVSKNEITVSGAVYKLEDGVEFQDMAGQRITQPEVRPGIAVELEFDEEGRLTLIRAAVVR